ncbi:hypothetical protein D3C80_959170 [compost metagenome]
MLAFVDVFWLDINAQGDVTARLTGELVFDAPQVTSHQGKQVGRFHERVFPGCPVPAIFLRAGTDRVAIGQQHRVAMLFGDHRGGEFAHHVRAVEVIGDLAKALGFTLGAEHAAGLVQAFQRGIALRVDLYAGVEREACSFRLHGEMTVVQLVVSRLQRLVVHGDCNQLQLLSI